MINQLFKFGSKKLNLEFPGIADLLEVNPPDLQVNKDSFYEGMNKNLDIREGFKVGIVVSDKTRLCGYELYLPWLTDNLEARGVKSSDIAFYIAYGTHPKQSNDESLKAYGETFLKYKFVHHDCSIEADHIKLGVSSRGTDILIRKDILDQDALILFGAISHHYFAGYGGGRKLIFPGLAYRDSIYRNHKLFIDFKNSRLDPGCQSGQLTGNPVAEDIQEIDSYFPNKLIISGILNTEGKVAILSFNKSYSEFRETCAIYDKCYRIESNKKYDLVIASAGGYPKDINFIQAHKSLHNAASFVKSGGKLILLAECIDGIGNKTFMSLFSGSKDEIIRNLEHNYSGNGGTALATLEKTSRITVYMKTDLSESDCKKMGILKVETEQIREIINTCTTDMAIISNASIIL